MKVKDSLFFKEFVGLCSCGYRKGWHERNGGNLSYRLDEKEVKEIEEDLKIESKLYSIGSSVPVLKNQYFLITGSGKFMKNVRDYPEECIGIIKINEDGTKYQKVWGLINNGLPTSELPTHLKNHEIKFIDTKGIDRVVYHCHPTNLISLTYVLDLNSEKFTHELWQMSTECCIVFPKGLGILPWMVPGQDKIAIESAKLMKKYDAVIWPFHGIFVMGSDFDTTRGLVETIEKASEILVKVRSMSNKKRQTITNKNFLELEKPFNVTLNKEVLKHNDKD